jgi:hypothetical protein
MGSERNEVADFGQAVSRGEQPEIEPGGRLAGPGNEGGRPGVPPGPPDGRGRPEEPGSRRREPPRGRSHAVV